MISEATGKKEIEVKDIIDIAKRENIIQFKILAGESGLTNKVKVSLINRPGVTLSGYFKNFAYKRIQLFGRGESEYLNDLDKNKKEKILEKFFSFKIPCCIFSHNLKPDKIFLTLANKYSVPVLVSKLSTGKVFEQLSRLLFSSLSGYTSFHGDLIEVFGIGVLILGDSGVGKSECALELVSNGHRLIADDVVIVNKTDVATVSGSGVNLVKHYMEIRGLGIIDIKSLFGIGSVRDSKQIDIVIFLEEWNSKKEYDRLGLQDKYYDILGVKIPYLEIPVKPGRNIPILIETAAKNQRLKMMGINAPLELDKKIFNR